MLKHTTFKDFDRDFDIFSYHSTKYHDTRLFLSSPGTRETLHHFFNDKKKVSQAPLKEKIEV